MPEKTYRYAPVVVVTCLAVTMSLLFRAATKPVAASAPSSAARDVRLAKAYRFQQSGWTYVHLEGSPSEIGFQHGYLLADEIADAFHAIQLEETHSTERGWNFFRKAAHEMLWPHIDAEYQQELQGIADGIKAKGIKMDIDDLVALNAFSELPDYYVPWLNVQEKKAAVRNLVAPGNCSAFIATGSATKDHQIVIAHNNWTSYIEGSRWVMMFDIVPEHGNRVLMDGFPGVITSDDDFGINSSGLMIAETTISKFQGWDPNGKPEFVRSRKALQYANSIDDYVRIIKDGNNGGYANDWLIGDRKTGEIAYLELGLKNTPLWRTRDGYFISSNFARDPKVLAEETTFDPTDLASSPNARKLRWEELMVQYKGQIDVDLAQKFMADHHDAYEKKEAANGRTLCGHGDAMLARDSQFEWDAFHPGGAVQGKATNSAMAARMSMRARAGHPCGADFIAKDFLDRHQEYSWQKPVLRDMKAGPWTTFEAGQKSAH
ncbi:MAG TPA: C45 family peptidase [Terriglobales bacterium]|nr:C45 family peptidase [Terriglobales bacterium]